MLEFILAATGLVAVEQPLPHRAVGATLFKNGYAVITREVDLPGPGEHWITQLPPAVLGTFWVEPGVGMGIQEVTATRRRQSRSVEINSMEDVLRLNIGRPLRIRLADNREIDGRLERVTVEVVILTTGLQGEATVIPRNQLREILPTTGLTWTKSEEVDEHVIRIVVTGRGGKVRFVSMERGITWAAAYNVGLTDGAANVTARATLLNDLVDLSEAEVRLVAGFPNLPYLGQTDPFTSLANIDQWVGAMVNVGAPGARRERMPVMTGQAAGAIGRDSDVIGAPVEAREAFEDLFFFRLPTTRLAKGDRMLRTLFTTTSPYEDVYEWNVTPVASKGLHPEPPEIWHRIRFPNRSEQPFTTGPVTILRGGQIVGQDLMTYVSIGGEARLTLARALDLGGEAIETEVEHERNFETIRETSYDRFRIRGEIEVTSRKTEPVKVELRRTVAGEVVLASDGGRITQLARPLSQPNGRGEIVWTIEVPPRATRKVTYEYRNLVPTR